MIGKTLEMKRLEDYHLAFDLVARGIVHVYGACNLDKLKENDNDAHLRFAINSGDTFYYACADVTEFRMEDVRELADMHERFPGYGLIAWSARERGETPIKELLCDEYYEAFNYAAKYFDAEYDYILICSATQKDDLQDYLADLGYIAQLVEVHQGRWAFRVRLTEARYHEVWRYAGCIYRYYHDNRVKECKHQYFQDGANNSIAHICDTVAKVLGLEYSFREGFHRPSELSCG